jgi:hypothetical protein
MAMGRCGETNHSSSNKVPRTVTLSITRLPLLVLVLIKGPFVDWRRALMRSLPRDHLKVDFATRQMAHLNNPCRMDDSDPGQGTSMFHCRSHIRGHQVRVGPR